MDNIESTCTLRYEFEKYKGNKKVSMIVATYNREKLLIYCLISLFNQNYPKDEYEIIVVDDGSTDQTEKMVKSLKPTCNFKYFYWPREEVFKLGEPKNRVALARNIGIENSKGEIILFVDSDMILDKNCLKRHVMLHKKYKNLVVIGYRNHLYKNSNSEDLILNKKVPFQDDYRDISSIIEKGRPWKLMYSNNASIKKSDLVKVGMFERTFINKFWGVEDIELAYKLFKAGLIFKMDRKAFGYHQYHDLEYVNPHNMLVGLRKNWEFIYKLHPSEEIYSGFLFSYDYELLNLGTNCNNDCLVCDVLQHKGSKNKTTKQIKDEMRELRKKSKSLLISGGEPTIRPDIFDILSYARSLKFDKIALETNGRMFSYKDFCNKIIAAGANNFYVYIHGPNANIHEAVTNSKGSFEQTLNGIINLTDAEQNVRAKVCIVKENYKYLLETFKLLTECDVKSIYFLVTRMPKEEGIIPKYTEIAKEIKKVFDCAEKNSNETTLLTLYI